MVMASPLSNSLALAHKKSLALLRCVATVVRPWDEALGSLWAKVMAGDNGRGAVKADAFKLDAV